MELLLIRQAAVLIASAAGSYTDHKTGFIYDWITLPLIAFGIMLNLFEQQYDAFIAAGIVFAVGYALYYAGKLGGGDVKLYTGIALALPSFGGSTYVLQVILWSALSAVIFLSTYYSVKYARKGIDWELNKPGIMKAILFLVIIAAYIWMVLGTGLVGIEYAAVIALPLCFGIVFIALEKGIKKEFFLKKVKLKELEEDEIIALEFMSEEEKKKIGAMLKGIIDESMRKELEKKGVTEILVYRDLPRFGVFIFIGALLAMLLPDIFLGGIMI